MVPFSIIFDEPAWPELASNPLVREGRIVGVAILDRGMGSGRPSVAFRVDAAGGTIVIAQTSARLFCTAANAIMTKYPDLFEGD